MVFVKCRKSLHSADRKMGITTCPIVWTKSVDRLATPNWAFLQNEGERFVTLFGSNIEVVVYGGYPSNRPFRSGGWHITVRVKRVTNFPNKLLAKNSHAKLADAQHNAIYAGLLFFAHCLIKNKKPEDMDTIC